MRYLRIATAAIVIAGLALVAGGVALRLDPVWPLAGAMLLWAGAIKVVVLRIWRHLGTDAAVRAPEDSYT